MQVEYFAQTGTNLMSLKAKPKSCFGLAKRSVEADPPSSTMTGSVSSHRPIVYGNLIVWTVLGSSFDAGPMVKRIGSSWR